MSKRAEVNALGNATLGDEIGQIGRPSQRTVEERGSQDLEMIGENGYYQGRSKPKLAVLTIREGGRVTLTMKTVALQGKQGRCQAWKWRA